MMRVIASSTASSEASRRRLRVSMAARACALIRGSCRIDAGLSRTSASSYERPTSSGALAKALRWRSAGSGPMPSWPATAPELWGASGENFR